MVGFYRDVLTGHVRVDLFVSRFALSIATRVISLFKFVLPVINFTRLLIMTLRSDLQVSAIRSVRADR